MYLYYFCDKERTVETDGTEYVASGVVSHVHGQNSESGKDLAVWFHHPFELYIRHEWRATNEVDLYPIPEHMQESLERFYSSG